MNIEIAKYSGYCYGVERAFRMVNVTASGKTKDIYTLGPLIHNKQAVEALKKEQGVGIVQSLGQINTGVVVIRTHGVPPRIIDEAKAKGLEVVDATCPFVKKAQRYAKELVDEGYHLVIIGEKDHPEVIGIKAHSGGDADIVEDEREAQNLDADMENLGIVIQTTQDYEKAGRVVGILAMKSANVKIYNTICDATFHRQFAARELAGRVDLMIVVGGKHSGNTRRLAEICKEAGAETYHIEEVGEVQESWFKNAEKIGVTAGASTPDFVLAQILDRLKEIDKKEGKQESDER